ncbi:unnamed protein product [Rotaria socialis]|uniref:C2H2-type domain-containing protein n=2 Tax=Rotaria socialis TaxID=392032 RepID=A0A821G2I4_9BILA|nr:unnamed protein product [Rotaria socialis]CAF4659224.1 unnamed protein product [Rotaria socialis]
MHTFGVTTSRCSLCYALLYTHTTSSTLGYSSSNRRYGNRCSIASIERLISSSKKFQNLWLKNHNGTINNRAICFRCCETIRQIEQIKDHIEKLDSEQKILMNKIERSLYKRALIFQGQKQHKNDFIPFSFNHRQIPINDDDDDTEEGEEKLRTIPSMNGHEHSPSIVMSTTTLVGAKRRKSKIAHRINIEDKPSLLNHAEQSNSPIVHSTEKLSPRILFNSHSSKHHRTGIFSTGIHAHHNDFSNLPFGSAYKSLTLQTASSSLATTPPFIDPTTGALIAIVSNPRHAALLAQQHHQMFKSSSISPTSTNAIDEHEIIPPKQLNQKKFPCLLCGRDFSNKSNLNRHHSIVHVAIRNFECARCPKKFKLRQGLKTHMQRCHGVNTDEPTFVLQKHHIHHHHH